ncbi:MAG: arylsulfatase [Gemmataceae bacterium]
MRRTSPRQEEKKKRAPNIILIMADDMGYGDLGFTGNPKIKTPNLDRLAKKSVRMKQFHVCPVCSPTRSSLLTGRYNYRTGVVDTFLGRSMMHPDEVTLAEVLAAMGYRTGIFGKWHLGDCYPLRPQDHGFQETLVLRGGGIGQPSDPPGGSSYFDPVLQHNGKQINAKGYCSDVFTEAALDFIGKNRDRPFFCYLPFNAPHSPHQVPESYEAPYRKMDLNPDQFPKVGFPLPPKAKTDDIAKVYGMVTNIDDNVGKVLAKLRELGLEEDTIVIFLTDNGASFPRFNAGMRGFKGSVFEGGTHVPFFVQWKGHLPEDRDVSQIAAHIDLVPTLLDLVGGKAAEGKKIDGVSLAPLWKGEKVDWPERNLFFQWHRGDVPQLFRACAVRSQKYRLVQPAGVDDKAKFNGLTAKFLLFDIESDPFEQNDISDKAPEVVQEMKAAYQKWFRDVVGTRTVVPPRIVIGAKEADPVVLTKQDWRGPKASWGPTGQGYWELKVAAAGTFEVSVHLPEKAPAGVVHLKIGGKETARRAEESQVTFEDINLSAGNVRLEAWLASGGELRAIRFVKVSRK